jgi:glyoxylate reductase
MMKQRVLVPRAIFPEVIEHLARHFEVDTNQGDELLSPDAFSQRLEGKHGVLLFGEPFTALHLQNTPTLRAVSNMSVGFNNLDLPALTDAGVLATNTPDVLNETTADFAWALMMAAARRVGEAEKWLRQGQWKGWSYDQFLGTDVHGSTLGIIGMGRIGRAIARRARGFEMRVVYHNRTGLGEALEQESQASYLSLDELLSRADHLILVAPYSAQTHHLIGESQLKLMKPTATLTHIGRGGVVDDKALIQALRSRVIAAAALDVFENEPRLNADFLQLPNVVLTPHMAPASEATRHRMAMLAADNLIASLNAEVGVNTLNPQALDVRVRLERNVS